MINRTKNNKVVKEDIKFGVIYNSDVEKLKYILLDIAKNTEHVITEPFQSVVFSEFADSNLNFVLNVWIDDINIASSVTNCIREKINTEFKASGIEMAYPRLEDVHLPLNLK